LLGETLATLRNGSNRFQQKVAVDASTPTPKDSHEIADKLGMDRTLIYEATTLKENFDSHEGGRFALPGAD
jgi:hypothetical protein